MNKYHKYYKNIAPLLFVLGAVFFYSCKNRSIEEWEEYSESTKPELVGKNIEIIQSRGGKVQFKVTMPKIIETQKNDAPYAYTCPQGIHVWQYDSLRNAAIELTADSAYVIEPEQYYELWHNVTITRKADSSKAVTGKVIINQKENKVFSDTAVIIVKFQNISDARADGFESDLSFNNPKFFNVTNGLVNYENVSIKRRQDSLTTDSIAMPVTIRQ